MAKVLTLGVLNAAYLIRESNGMYRSREEVDVDGGADGLEPGTILGRVTATGTYVRLAPGASDGSQTVAGILFEGIAPKDPDEPDNVVRRTITARDAEVHKTELIYSAGATAPQITAADTGLRALGIIPRL